MDPNQNRLPQQPSPLGPMPPPPQPQQQIPPGYNPQQGFVQNQLPPQALIDPAGLTGFFPPGLMAGYDPFAAVESPAQQQQFDPTAPQGNTSMENRPRDSKEKSKFLKKIKQMGGQQPRKGG